MFIYILQISMSILLFEFQYYYLYHLKIMTNPFSALQVYDEEEEGFGKLQDTKPKKGEILKKNVKNQKVSGVKKHPEANRNQDINLQPKHADPTYKKYRQKQTKDNVKDIGEGHTLDRRSGTGREDRPRKQGGGRGNIGNLEDQLKREKYEKQNDKTDEIEEEKKPEQPKGVTLQQYYESKGVNLQNWSKKQQVKKEKGEINAQWIKKQKLTVIETKEDKKISERNEQKGKKQYTQNVATQNSIDGNLLGFTSKVSKPARQERPQRIEKGERTHDHQKGDGKPHKQKKKEIVNLNHQDFPAL